MWYPFICFSVIVINIHPHARKHSLVHSSATKCTTVEDHRLPIVLCKQVVEEIQKLHEPIQPLKEFHYGGDEVGRGAWVNSSLCQQLQMSDSMANHSLKQYFFKVRVHVSCPND